MCGSISRFSVLFRRSIYASRHTPEDCGFSLALLQSCFGCARFLGELGLSSVRRQCLMHGVRYKPGNRGVSRSASVRTVPAPAPGSGHGWEAAKGESWRESLTVSPSCLGPRNPQEMLSNEMRGLGAFGVFALLSPRWGTPEVLDVSLPRPSRFVGPGAVSRASCEDPLASQWQWGGGRGQLLASASRRPRMVTNSPGRPRSRVVWPKVPACWR